MYKHLVIDKPGLCYGVLPSSMVRDYLINPSDADKGFLKTSHPLNLVLFASFDFDLALQVRDYLESFDYNSKFIKEMLGVTVKSQKVPKFDIIHLNYSSDDYWQHVDNFEPSWQRFENKVHQNEIMNFICIYGVVSLLYQGSRKTCQILHENEIDKELLERIRADFQNPNII